jgi:hypothetical protein
MAHEHERAGDASAQQALHGDLRHQSGMIEACPDAKPNATIDGEPGATTYRP